MPGNVEVESQLRYVKKLFSFVYSRITVRRHPLNWSDRLELLALELKKSNSKKTLVCVCYRPSNPGLKPVVRVVYDLPRGNISL